LQITGYCTCWVAFADWKSAIQQTESLRYAFQLAKPVKYPGWEEWRLPGREICGIIRAMSIADLPIRIDRQKNLAMILGRRVDLCSRLNKYIEDSVRHEAVPICERA
jgi:hypothetical protein